MTSVGGRFKLGKHKISDISQNYQTKAIALKNGGILKCYYIDSVTYHTEFFCSEILKGKKGNGFVSYTQ